MPPAHPPLVSPDAVFQEANGLVAIEAEHFVKQTRDVIRPVVA